MSDIFSAIADPIRRQILDALAEKSELSVGELVTITSQGQPAVSKHLKTLREVGLVTVKTVGQNRLYALDADALKPVAAWVVKHAAAKVEAEAAERADEVAAKIGGWLAEGADWLGEKLAEQTKVRDSQELGREVGRKLAEVFADADKALKSKTGKDVDEIIVEVKKKVAEVRSKLN
ncbi:MAG: ArsR/SmtB family transcription factor [Micrococcales bacterium]